MAFRFLRQLNIFQIAVPFYLFISGRLSLEFLGLGALALVLWLAAAVVKWWRYVFWIEGDELKVARGVFSLERTAIPLDRVQSVSIEQQVLHRLVNLVRVSVDTAGSSSAELVLDAVSRDSAEALQRLAADFQASRVVTTTGAEAGEEPGTSQHVPPPPSRVLVKRTPLELVKVGLARWPLAGLVVLGPLVAAGADIAETFAEQLGGFLPDGLVVEEELDSLSTSAIVGLLLLVVAVAALLGWTLQVLRSILTDWNLTVTQTAEGLRRDAGLVSRRSHASKTRRIQSVDWQQSPVERLLGISRLRLQIIGEGDLVVPGADEADVSTLNAIAFGGATSDSPPPDRGVSSAMVFLAVRNAAFAMVASVLGLVVLSRLSPEIDWRWWMVTPLLIVPLQLASSWWRWRNLRWGANSGRIVRTERFVGRHRVEMENIKAQMVSVTESPFQRRRSLASVTVSTPEGGMSVPMLANDEAGDLRDLVLAGIESDSRAWM